MSLRWPGEMPAPVAVSRSDVATRASLLAQTAADDRLQVESGDVVAVGVGHQNNAGRETMSTSTGAAPLGVTECVSWAP